jgi:hypothetical protein
MAMKGLAISLSVKPKAFSSALWGARSIPFFTSSLLMFCASWLWFICLVGLKSYVCRVLCDFFSIAPLFKAAAWSAG